MHIAEINSKLNLIDSSKYFKISSILFIIVLEKFNFFMVFIDGIGFKNLSDNLLFFSFSKPKLCDESFIIFIFSLIIFAYLRKIKILSKNF